jgi:riboflavin kinase/FMN adenylyltransferase
LPFLSRPTARIYPFLPIFAHVLTVQNTIHFRIESPSIVTIGTFDGVHLGHQKILDRLKKLKEETGLKTVILTFDPHPRKVLFPEQNDLKLLTTVEEKLELFSRHGVDVTVVYPFSKTFSQIDSEVYLRDILVKSLNTRHIVIGYDHKFGRDRSGDFKFLKAHMKELNFQVQQISAEDIDNIAISSSKIRKALEEGNLSMATEYLGHTYFLHGRVIKGKQLGRQLGYPTANLVPDSEDKLIPRKGIYFVEVVFEGLLLYGMLSIGTNPTTDYDEGIKIEVHIFDFDADIYGKQLQINFVKRLRDEKKFANLSQLKHALDKDREQCLELIASAQ